MILDWVGVGLLDHPQRRSKGRGRGSAKALFSPEQRHLFNVLVDQHAHIGDDGSQTAGRFATLVNIPVWLWLQSVEGIPLRQVRKAMTTFVNAYGVVSTARAQHSARELLDQLAHPHATAKAKKHFAQIVAAAAKKGTFDREEFLHAAWSVIDPADTGIVTTPQAAVIGDLATAFEARYEAVNHLEHLADTDYQRARWIYNQNWNDSMRLNAIQPTATIDDLYAQFPESTLEQRVNEACNDLLTLLGVGVLYARDHPSN
jgi:hypothetical protein